MIFSYLEQYKMSLLFQGLRMKNRGAKSTEHFSLLNSNLAVISDLKYNTEFAERFYFIWNTSAIIVPLSLF